MINRPTVGLLTVLVLSAAHPAAAQKAISTDGVVHSSSGGFKFPDGSVQTSVAQGGSAFVEDSGVDASQCFDADGNARNCAGTGEDGETLAGVTWPTPRFANNGDGTITDHLTGLIWLEDANCSGGGAWQDSLDWIESFNTSAVACTNYAAMTFSDWRLPNVKELLSLVDYGEWDPALPSGHPFASVETLGANYWSSSSYFPFPNNGWGVSMLTGTATQSPKPAGGFVWPVRGGK